MGTMVIFQACLLQMVPSIAIVTRSLGYTMILLLLLTVLHRMMKLLLLLLLCLVALQISTVSTASIVLVSAVCSSWVL